MLNFYDFANRYDFKPALLAVMICAVGACAASAIGRYAGTSVRGWPQTVWSIVTTITLASAIWAMHFIAMLGYYVPMPSGFVPLPILQSYVMALAFVAVAIHLRITARRRRTAIAAGVVMGLAISAIQYTEMNAFRVVGTVTTHAPTVLISVLLGIGFSVLASLSFFEKGRFRIYKSATFAFLAVCGNHFIAMSAATVTYDPNIALPAVRISGRGLSMIVAAVVALIVCAALAVYGMNLRAWRRRLAERRRIEDFAECAVEGLVICDGDTIVWANRSVHQLVGGLDGFRVGGPLASLLTLDAIDLLCDDHEVDVVLHTALGGMPVRAVRKPIELEGRAHTVITFRDQRERLRIEAEMRRLAGSDTLTGLANRTHFNDALARRITSRRASEREVALLSIDLDLFKIVNDTHGIDAGDALLVRVAGRISSAVRDGAFIARIGGDHFAIIVARMGEPDGVPALAARLVEILARPFLIDGRIHEIAASIGVALAPTDGDSAVTLMHSAELALHRAKDDGGGTFRFFQAEMDTRIQARAGLELALRRASARCEFELYYQPQVDAKTGLYDGAEALIRWNRPEYGLVPPCDFIPIAEETNLIVAIGEWALHTACVEAATWPSHLHVAVNLSAIQFRDPHLLTVVRSALEASGLAPHRLELEVTESALIDDEATVLGLLTSFKALGLRLSLDDFGTGYSSLSHLRRFPFDKIKIDRAFVILAAEDRDSGMIVRAIVSLGASLGLQITAEGVETEAQRRFVVDEGCDQIQGYLISRPLPVAYLPSEFKSAPKEIKPCRSFDFSTAATAI